MEGTAALKAEFDNLAAVFGWFLHGCTLQVGGLESRNLRAQLRKSTSSSLA